MRVFFDDFVLEERSNKPDKHKLASPIAVAEGLVRANSSPGSVRFALAHLGLLKDDCESRTARIPALPHFKVTLAKGVPQGGTLSPLFFVIALNGVLSSLTPLCGYQFKDTAGNAFDLKSILYADDCSLISSNFQSLSEMMDGTGAHCGFKEALRLLGLKINEKKTDVRAGRT